MKREPTEPRGFIKPNGVGIPRLQAGEEVKAPRLCLGCARLYIETGVSEAANGHRSRARICVALYYQHHVLAVMLAAGALFEAAHVILLSVGL